MTDERSQPRQLRSETCQSRQIKSERSQPNQVRSDRSQPRHARDSISQASHLKEKKVVLMKDEKKSQPREKLKKNKRKFVKLELFFNFDEYSPNHESPMEAKTHNTKERKETKKTANLSSEKQGSKNRSPPRDEISQASYMKVERSLPRPMRNEMRDDKSLAGKTKDEKKTKKESKKKPNLSSERRNTFLKTAKLLKCSMKEQNDLICSNMFSVLEVEEATEKEESIETSFQSDTKKHKPKLTKPKKSIAVKKKTMGPTDYKTPWEKGLTKQYQFICKLLLQQTLLHVTNWGIGRCY